MCGDLVVKPETNVERHCSMMDFVSQELEQSRMCQHHTFVFCDVDCQLLPESFVEKVAKSRVCAIIGPVQGGVDAPGAGDVEWSRKYVVKKEGEGGEDDEETEGADEKKVRRGGSYRNHFATNNFTINIIIFCDSPHSPLLAPLFTRRRSCRAQGLERWK